MLGYSEEELKQKNWAEMTHPDDLEPDLAQFKRLVGGDIDGYEMEKRFIRKNGEMIYTHMSISSSRNPDNSFRFIIASLLDITDRVQAAKEQQRLNDQLHQAQKMESIGHLAGGIAHDFNNILTVIQGHTEMALSKIDEHDPTHKYLSAIHNTSLRSARLVHQLMVKLCVNARDAIDDVGKVIIETSNVVISETYCGSHVVFIPGEYVCISVSDNGSGMSAETKAKVFDPFFTTKKIGEGTGLGLATVYGIIKQNKGYITVYSEEGIGTTFKIFFVAV